jgi:hypothetical protein
MKPKYFAAKDLLYIIPASAAISAWLASVQAGSWFIGFASFSFLLLLSFTLLIFSSRWANGGRTLGWIIALAIYLRFGVGMILHFGRPIYGHADEDDRAGYVFTDAHRRDDQAWNLATSEHPVIDAFSQRYGSDQYGGLLAFNTFVYRYFSPDAHRPLMLVLLSAFFSAFGIPFLWKAMNQVFGEKVAWASALIFALYADSVLLGASAMREPYLLTFNTIVLWGFVHRFYRFEESPTLNRLSDLMDLLKDRIGWMWIALGLAGMLLVSPAIALITIIILAGWLFFTNERREISWRGIGAIAVLFVMGLFFLSSSLNRSGEFIATSPLHVINDWFQAAVKFDAYQLERDSGWVQKIFDEGPAWIRLPFIAIYGIFQRLTCDDLQTDQADLANHRHHRRGWYALLPVLTLSFVAAAGQGSRKMRNLVLWLSLLVWTLVLLASLRGGADLFDNPRYRTIFFVWQAILAGYVWVWWRETRNAWFIRVVLMEVVFLLFFTQWYASRYFHWGVQLPFAIMVALILGSWAIILGMGLWRDRRSDAASAMDTRSTSQSDSVDKSRA